MPQEDYVNQLFDRLYEFLPKRQRGFVQEHIAGGGSDMFIGLAWADSYSVQLTHSGDLTVLLMGSIENPTDMEDGEYILDEYQNSCGDPFTEGQPPPALDILAQIGDSSGYAFIIFDRQYDRITIARDPEGLQPLYWGPSQTLDGLVFSSEACLLDADCATSNKEFPAGTLFMTYDCSTEGVNATIGPHALLHPNLCKVESASNIQGVIRRVASSRDIES